jgi:predicted enzyme related to lactoylglutathione lyase
MRSGTWIPYAMVLCVALGGVLGMVVQSARGSSDDKDAPKATGVGGFFFKAKSPGTLAEWYRVHLGIALQAGGKGENAPQFYSFEWREKEHPDTEGATAFSIFPADTKYFGQGGSQFMVNFRVTNLDQLLAQLRKDGVKVEDKVEDASYGRFGWATDGEGNRIELWEPK